MNQRVNPALMQYKTAAVLLAQYRDWLSYATYVGTTKYKGCCEIILDTHMPQQHRRIMCAMSDDVAVRINTTLLKIKKRYPARYVLLIKLYLDYQEPSKDQLAESFGVGKSKLYNMQLVAETMFETLFYD